MKKAIIAACVLIATICTAQTEPLANARSYSDTTAKPIQSIMKQTYPPLEPVSPAATPTVDLNLPKAKVVNGFVIIPIPHRSKKKKPLAFD
jgi:hypothetical protein